ncbi:MAG: M23 family metallopeptidase [Cyclobacteriaceae bacterium]
MTQLTDNQLELVEKTILENGVKGDLLKAELLDHICCAIEVELEDGKDFYKSLESVLKGFGDRELCQMEDFIGKYKRKKSILRKLRLSTTSIAACLMLLVLGVDAQERPQIKPLETSYRLSSPFGTRMHPILKEEKFHSGVDMVVPIGTPVQSTADGIVVEIEVNDKGHGLYIIVKHDNNFETMYANLKEAKVKVGQDVEEGQLIALSGNSGKSTGPHLHYEVIKNGERVNPEEYFSEY